MTSRPEAYKSNVLSLFKRPQRPSNPKAGSPRHVDGSGGTEMTKGDEGGMQELLASTDVMVEQTKMTVIREDYERVCEKSLACPYVRRKEVAVVARTHVRQKILFPGVRDRSILSLVASCVTVSPTDAEKRPKPSLKTGIQTLQEEIRRSWYSTTAEKAPRVKISPFPSKKFESRARASLHCR